MSESGEERSVGGKNAGRQERGMGRGSWRDIEKIRLSGQYFQLIVPPVTLKKIKHLKLTKTFFTRRCRAVQQKT